MDPGPPGAATQAEVGEIIKATKRRECNSLGLVLGANYAGSPIVVSDGSNPPPESIEV